MLPAKATVYRTGWIVRKVCWCRISLSAEEVLQTIKFTQLSDGTVVVEDVIENSNAAKVCWLWGVC